MTASANKIWKITILICIGVIAAGSANAGSNWAYAPPALKTLFQVFPQKCIQTDEEKGKLFEAHGVKGTYKENLSLAGSTRLGKTWSLKLCPVTESYQVWEADFDRNGEPDLAIITPTGGVGYACSSRVLFIMFDKDRTPKVFAGFSTGLQTERATKKPDKTTGRASAVVPGIQDIRQSDSKDTILVLRSVEHDGDRSYWRTSAWKAKNSKWTEMHNIHNTRLPCYVRFTNKPNNRPSTGMDYLGENAASTMYEITKPNELEKDEEYRIK